MSNGTEPGTAVEVHALADALALGGRELVSIVGGGGKTTTLFSLGRHLAGSVVMTTTTKMGSERADGFRVVIDPTDADLAAAVATDARVVAWRGRAGHRADGFAPEVCDRWFERAVASHIVVEADGSRRKPFKAPEPWEPVVPRATSMLIACIGAGALGRPIDEVCFRVGRVTDLVGCPPTDPLTPSRAAEVLASTDGSRRGCPPDARYVVCVHGADRAPSALVDELVERLGDRGGRIEVVLVRSAPR